MAEFSHDNIEMTEDDFKEFLSEIPIAIKHWKKDTGPSKYGFNPCLSVYHRSAYNMMTRITRINGNCEAVKNSLKNEICHQTQSLSCDHFEVIFEEIAGLIFGKR